MKDHDLVCFSHLRWNFVFQRPQHLMTRFSQERRVFYFEEPMYVDGHDHYQLTEMGENLWVVVPQLGHDNRDDLNVRLERLLHNLFTEKEVIKYIFWYYTPMSMEFTSSFNPSLVVYDCMDELAAFKFAPPTLKDNENKLFEKADLVFTGGHTLYEAKKDRHPHVYAFPSSIDKDHFRQGRTTIKEPGDQQMIPHPRLGFYGVIDERLDIELIGQVATLQPEWQFIIIGPVVKIDEATLPRQNNIHYLGSKSYQELPLYLGGWDIAMIPFALNESTRFISPTKTPEYLAAGKPVISSSIQDVVNPYGKNKLVRIADTPGEFIHEAKAELSKPGGAEWLKEVDDFLQDNSWDITWNKMMQLIENKLEDKGAKKKINTLNLKEYIYV